MKFVKFNLKKKKNKIFKNKFQTDFLLKIQIVKIKW